MRPLGAKSVAMTFIFLGTLALVLSGDRFSVEQIRALSAAAAFCISFFTVLAATLTYRLLQLNQPSQTYFRWISPSGVKWTAEQTVLQIGKYALLIGRTSQNVFTDYPPFVMRALIVGLWVIISIICFNARSVDLIFDTPRKLINAGARYCPVEDPLEAKTEKKPGCELIYRAFELGYVKDLGTCAPDKKEEKLELCTLRQVDEPYLHYSWRHFMMVLDGVRRSFSKGHLIENHKNAFDAQIKHIDTLAGRLTHIVRSAPKASHHIFTNLPPPQGMISYYWNEWFRPNDCMSRYRTLPHTIDIAPDEDRAASRIFDHVYGQMLFNPKYDDIAGDCKEYKIHWNSPVDSCEQLSRDPIQFIKSMGIEKDIQVVLNRVDEAKDFARLHEKLSELDVFSTAPPKAILARNDSGELKPRAEVSPETVISFQCFMKADKEGGLMSQERVFKYNNLEFKARDVQFFLKPHRIHVDMYKAFSQAMAEGFSYIGYLSHEGQGQANGWRVTAESFAKNEYPLSQLEYLKGADIFYANEWLQEREDLLEVYPYYHHLYHFIKLFRQQYRMQRTRI